MSAIEQHLAPSELEQAAALTLRHEVGDAGVLTDGAPSAVRVCRALHGKGEMPGQFE